MRRRIAPLLLAILVLALPCGALLSFKGADPETGARIANEVPSYTGRFFGSQAKYPGGLPLNAVPYNPELDPPACFDACSARPAKQHGALDLVVFTIGAAPTATCDSYTALEQVRARGQGCAFGALASPLHACTVVATHRERAGTSRPRAR